MPNNITIHPTWCISNSDVCISLYDVKSAQRLINVQVGQQNNKRLLNFQTWVLGGAYRDRTDDPLLAKQVLSQLS